MVKRLEDLLKQTTRALEDMHAENCMTCPSEVNRGVQANAMCPTALLIMDVRKELQSLGH